MTHIDERTPDPVDLHVGARIRTRRRILGISQEKLADALGLTFQQVQKYERGANRVSSSKLYATAKVLQVTPAYFFEGLPEDDRPIEGGQDPIQQLALTAGGLALASAYIALPAHMKRAMLSVSGALLEGAEREPPADTPETVAEKAQRAGQVRAALQTAFQ